MKKHKVVYYIESTAFGGAEQMLFNLLQGIDRNEWDPELVYRPHPGIATLTDKIKSIDVRVTPSPVIAGPKDLKGKIAFIKMIRRLKPAVFHAHLVSNLRCSWEIICANLAGKMAILATQHSFQEPRALTKHRLYTLRLYQKIVSIFVDRYIAVSRQQATSLKKYVISNNRVEVIHNGVNLDYFCHRTDNSLLKSIFMEKTERPFVLTVARMDDMKGHRYLIEAATQVPDVVFLLAGDGPERNNLESLARELNVSDRIIFLGYRDDVPDLLQICDLFVLPSLLEGLSLSVLEAMASLKPVIATNVGGMSEIIINEKSGFLIPPANSKALAEKINQLLSNPELAETIATRGRQRVRDEFSIDKMVLETSRLYNELIEKKRIEIE